MTLGLAQRIRTVLKIAPEAPALEYKGTWYSWGAIAASMEAAESLLCDAGLKEGAPIGLLLRNQPSSLSMLLQVLASRRCVVTINPFQSAEKIARDIADLKVGAIIAAPSDWDSQELVDSARSNGCLGISIRSMDGTIEVAPLPALRTRQQVPEPESLPGTAIMMLSSGTTGPAKRIALPYDNFERSLLDAAYYEDKKATAELVLKQTPAMLSIPLVHIGGMFAAVAAIIGGRPLIIMDKFVVDEWRHAVSTYQPKLVSLPPTALRMVLDAKVPKEDLASLLAIRTGSAPLDPDLQIAFEEHYGIPLLDAYGATEFAGAVAGWSLRDHKKFAERKRGSVGRAQPNCELRVIDAETGAVLGTNQIGLLEVRSAQVDAERWVRTTDLAEIDNDGFLFIRGRADSAIIRGGFKVLPRDVETALREHPAIKEICVVGVPDQRLGAIPVAALETQPNTRISEEELVLFARSKLVPYQIPARWLVVDSLPRTPSLKISQHEVKQLFMAPAGATKIA